VKRGYYGGIILRPIPIKPIAIGTCKNNLFFLFLGYSVGKSKGFREEVLIRLKSLMIEDHICKSMFGMASLWQAGITPEQHWGFN